jgi:signal transduction histidine kinase
MRNLVNNAIHHAGAPAEVRVERRGSVVTVAVMDHGPGLPQEIMQAPGERSEGAQGLGLYIARTIAETHGGRLYARNLSPRGAVVAFELPIAEGAS